ncbi:MAG TPA: helix-turn-helix domain-containing protein, partial [Myxococcota bacterium]|nr:helix-turn-helix domain-containing protein [Myxococcota bacterium]
RVAAAHLGLGPATTVPTGKCAGCDVRPRGPATQRASMREAVAAFQRRMIVEALERHGGNRAAAARDLGLDRANFHRLAARLGLGNVDRR